ncbi:MAG: cell division protein FtsZ [Burkholderiales bacterium]
MSLTVLLAILGGIVLAAVVIHGAWQTQKAGPKRAEQKGGAQDSRPASDSRLNTGLERIEPSLDFGGGDALTSPSRPSPEADPAVSEPSFSTSSQAVNPKRLSLRQELRLDALIDAIAPISLEAPISGELLLSHLPPSRRAGSKPMRIEGLNADTGEWEFALPGQRYSEVQAGVQLANRTGAMNNIEFSEFAQKVQTLADLIGGMADMPDMLEETARARELDAFASAHDAQLAVHLRARAAAWSVGYIVQHAGRHGFVPGVLPGRLVLAAHEEGAPPILTLTFDAQAALADDPQQAAVRDVTLSFDVPQTAREAQPFAAWQASAQALSLGMDASIVDDNGQALSGEGFAAIGHELERLYEALAQRDMAAGSALARRLFS